MLTHRDPTSDDVRPRLRRDLQGLRGLGVGIVVVGHLWRWPPGAFLMLDVFFVLSGFLITSILARAFVKYGPGFFVVFALSRVRRLMPMAATVILVTIALYYAVFSNARGAMVAEDGVWALLLAVNWHFARSGTDYFQAEASGSPLLHYWSLSVEEQFYAVWPLLIFSIIWWARRRSPSPTAALAAGIATVTVVAFVYSMWHSSADPAAAYFSTFDRVWQFGAGGLLAVFGPRLARLPFRVAASLSWAGAAGLLATLLLNPLSFAFPAPYGLVPVLCTGALIVGGMERDTRYIRFLDNAPMIYLGDLSYSIYLWHLPVLALFHPFFPAGAVSYYVWVIAVTLLVSWVGYYLIERPLRYAPWLMTRAERERQRDKEPAPGPLAVVRGVRWPRWRDAGLGALTVVAIAMSTFVVLQPEPAPTAPPASSESDVDTAGARAKMTIEQRHEQLLLTALQSDRFPTFKPGLEELAREQWYADMMQSGCVDVTPAIVTECEFAEDKPLRRAVVIGDSYAVAWMPGIRKALTPQGWSVQQLTMTSCPSWTLDQYVMRDGEPFPACAAHHDDVRDYVRRVEPDLLIVASAPGQVMNTLQASLTDDEELLAERGLARTLDDLMPWAQRTVVLAPPPNHESLTDCVTRIGHPESCVSRPDSKWDAHVVGESVAAETAGAAYVQTEPWFCLDQACPGFVASTPVTVDGSHMSIEYSRMLAPLLRQALLRVESATN